MLPTDRLDYTLPQERIATHPAQPRDASRLMVVSRTDPDHREHRTFRDLTDYLRDADVLVRNRSTVVPARIAGVRTDSGGRVEGLFLSESPAGTWHVMLRSNGRLREAQQIELRHPDALTSPTSVLLTLIERHDAVWTASIQLPVQAPASEVLARVGATPLPPYILAARRGADDHTPDERDRSDYQTIYADPRAPGSIAAPTAGLHFTPELELRLDALGVARAEVLLHVGAGTFAPITSDHVEEHPIHEETIDVTEATLRSIRDARDAGGRSIVVGTTTARALESVAPDQPAYRGPTDLLITPGHRWTWTDALITNFHLPRSTLIAMVAACFAIDDPVGYLLDCYREAIDQGYRFYSFGDAMLILP